ncbi:MAG: RDD family protein [Chitinophagales bacterium]|nr:RDD family protein [Chitinophagales bacterium]
MIQNSRRRERIIAALIDGLVLIPIMLPFVGLIHFGLKFHFVSNTASLVIGFLYYVFYVYSNQTTIGKKNQRLMIHSHDGSRISYQ